MYYRDYNSFYKSTNKLFHSLQMVDSALSVQAPPSRSTWVNKLMVAAVSENVCELLSPVTSSLTGFNFLGVSCTPNIKALWKMMRKTVS